MRKYFTADRIIDCVNAYTVSDVQNPVPEIIFPIVDDMVSAMVLGHADFFGRSYRSNDGSALDLGDFNGGDADAPAPPCTSRTSSPFTFSRCGQVNAAQEVE